MILGNQSVSAGGKISKICVFGRLTWRVTFWKANFENYSRYSLIKWYQFFGMSNTSFCFMPHHAQISCLIIIGLTINAITVTITVKGWHWRLLIYVLHIFYYIIMLHVFRSNHHCSWKFHKFHRKKTALESLFFSEIMKLYKEICSAWMKVDLHSANVSRANDATHWQFFFQSTSEANKMFFLLNKFVIFTNQKPVLNITAGQQSLTIVKTFVTTEKPHQMVTMTATT